MKPNISDSINKRKVIFTLKNHLSYDLSMILTIKFYLSFGYFSHYVFFFFTFFLITLSVGFSWTLVLRYKKKNYPEKSGLFLLCSHDASMYNTLPGITISHYASPIWYLKASGHKQAVYKTCPQYRISFRMQPSWPNQCCYCYTMRVYNMFGMLTQSNHLFSTLSLQEMCRIQQVL